MDCSDGPKLILFLRDPDPENVDNMTPCVPSKHHNADSFKNCSNCQARWPTLEAFMEDPAIEVVGYMPTFDNLLNGLFLFNHDCGTTLACPVALFAHLYAGPIYQVKKAGHSECPGYCQHKSNLSPCPVECNCAYVRETLQIIKKWPKAARQG